MRVLPTTLPEVQIVEPNVFGDARGALVEVWNAEKHSTFELLERCVLDLVSVSSRGVVRGLHYQEPSAQAKLVSVLDGEILDVAVDIRRGSPTFGRWTSVVLSSANRRQLFLPTGFAHGFAVTTERAVLHYKLSEHHRPDAEHGILWNDPDLAISWPFEAAVVSPRDAALPRLNAIPDSHLPVFRSP